MRIAVMLIATVFLVACATQQPRSAASTAPTQTAAGSGLTEIFDHENVREYKYRSTMYTKADKTIISHYTTTVTDEPYKGTPAWHVKTAMEIEGAALPPNSEAYTDAWFGKKDELCVHAENVNIMDGKKTVLPAPCGPAMAYGNPFGVTQPYIRDTTVKLPLGSFNVKMYGIEGAVIYFMDDDVPVPVMMTWGNGTPGPGTVYFELESYS